MQDKVNDLETDEFLGTGEYSKIRDMVLLENKKR